MNTRYLGLLLLGIMPHLSAAPQNGDKVRTIRGELTSTEYTLPNGLTVVLTPNPKAPTTAVYHWVKVGSAHETPGITGIAHLFEHMMFRPLVPGAKTFDDRLQEFGGSSNANTRYQATVYTTSVPNGQLEPLLQLESERFKKLQVTDDTLKMEREAVRSEYSTKIDTSPVMDLWFTIFQKGFENHPYGWTIVGQREDLDKIKASDCNAFFAKYYKPNNIGLFISGDFDIEQARKWIASYYGDWAAGEKAADPVPYKNTRGFQFAEGKLPAQANNLMLGYYLPPITADNYQTYLLAKHILVESSRPLADKRLIDDSKVATDVDAFNTDYDWGLFEVLVRPKSTDYATIYSEFGKLADDVERLSDAEFNAYLKEFQIGSAENIQRNEFMNDTLSLYWGKYGSIDALTAALQKPLTVTKAQVAAYVKTLLDKNNLVAVASKKQ